MRSRQGPAVEQVAKHQTGVSVETASPLRVGVAMDKYESVWDAVADTPEEAANLRARAALMHKITALVKTRRWTQAVVARNCGVTQPRMNDLLQGRLSRFSLHALVNIATAIASHSGRR